MKTSAGIAILYKNKVLLAHASNAAWKRTYGPPKGAIEEGELPAATAVREVHEEISVLVKKEKLLPPITVDYNDHKGRTFKQVILYPFKIKDLSEIGIASEKLPKSMLQLDEVDDVRFFEEADFEEYVMPRYHEPLKKLIEKYAYR